MVNHTPLPCLPAWPSVVMSADASACTPLVIGHLSRGGQLEAPSSGEAASLASEEGVEVDMTDEQSKVKPSHDEG